MKLGFLATLLIISFLFVYVESKSKPKVGKAAKKIKKFFVHKNHHKNKKESSTVSSFTRSYSIISPTATTFTQRLSTFLPKDVYFTYTDKNYNYFLGYPRYGVNGANYYRNPKVMIAQPTQRCGCDNKIIIVTRAPNYEIV